MNKVKTDKQSSGETVMLYKNIDLSRFVHVKQTYNDKTTYALKYKTDSGKLEDIGIQLPLLRAPFGIKNVEDPKYNPNGENMWKINLSLDKDSDKYNKNNAVEKLIDFMKEIDKLNCQYLAKNSEEIYGEKREAEDIGKFLYKSVVRRPNAKALKKAKENGKVYNDSIQAKVQVYKDGNPGFKAFMEHPNGEVEEIKDMTSPELDENGVQLKTAEGKPMYKINWEIFSKSFDCRVILKCDKISVIGNSASYFSWKLHVVKMIASSKKEITKEIFVQDDDDEQEESQEQDEIKETSETVEEDEVEEDEVENDDD